MIRKTKSTRSGYVRVLFQLPACLWADQIYVVGEFNNWNNRTLPMSQERDGTWRLTLDLVAGKTFEFRYLVDGRWLTDNHADALVDNEFGSQNSVIKTVLPTNVYEMAVEQPLL